MGSGAVALTFPERLRVSTVDGKPSTYLAVLRAGLAEIKTQSAVRQAALLAAAIPAMTCVDEYVPLLASTMVGDASAVPLLIFLQVAAMTLGALAAGRWSALSGGRLGAALTVAAASLAAGALSGHPAGFVGVAVAFGVLQLAMVLANARLQDAIAGPARATVLSVAGTGAEIGAVLVFAGYALGSTWLSTPVLVAAFALPLLAIAALTPRWLPDPASDAARRRST